MDDYIIPSRNAQNRLIALVCGGAFIANLDATIVNIALPTLSQQFHVSASLVSWTVLAYLLCETGFMLPFGKLADIKGIKIVYLAGFIVFMLGSLLCGTARHMGSLIAFRALQGVGGALLFTVMMTFIPIYLPRERRVKTTGLVTTAAAAGVALGPPIGGWITAFWGWRWIFYVNLPLCLAAIYASYRYIPSAYPFTPQKRFDFRGSAYSIFGLVFFLYAVNRGQGHGWTSPIILGSFALSFTLAAAFFIREWRIDYPLIDFKLFRNKLLTYSLLSLSASLMTVGGVLYLFPFYLVEYRKLNTHEAGMIVMLVALGQFIGPYTGRLSQKVGVWRVCMAGLLVSLGAFFLFLRLGPQTPVGFIVFCLALFGLSQGLGKSPNVAIIMGSAPAGNQSAVSSVMSVFRSLSTALGVLFFGAIFSNSTPNSLSQLAPGFENAFYFGAAASVAAIGLMLAAGLWYVRQRAAAARAVSV